MKTSIRPNLIERRMRKLAKHPLRSNTLNAKLSTAKQERDATEAALKLGIAKRPAPAPAMSSDMALDLQDLGIEVTKMTRRC